jgi:EmrB/QacA subfamily drug resistance transporter
MMVRWPRYQRDRGVAEQISAPARDSVVPGRLRHHGALTLAVIMVCQLMVIVDTNIVNVALPRIQGSLHLPVSSLSWVVNAYTLTFGGLLLLGGRAGDIWGRRRVLTGGVLLFSLASLAGGLATNGAWLFAARAAQGVGAALASPAALALIATSFAEGPPRNRALGLYASVSGLAVALGMVLGGLLVDWVSWRWVFFVNVPPGLALGLAAPVVLAESARQPGRFDLGGAASGTAGVAALVYGFVHASSVSWGDRLTVAAFLAGALLLVLFVVIETHARQPITPLHLVTDRRRAMTFLIRLMITAALIGMMFMLTLFVQDVMGYSPLLTGLVFVPNAVALMAGARIARRLLDRAGPRPLMISGAVLTAAAMVLLAFTSAGTGGYLPGIIGTMLVAGVGLGLLLVAMTYAAVAGVRAGESGAASGLLSSMQQVGGSLGIATMVTVAGRAAVGEAHRAALVAGITRAFVLGVGFTGCVLLLALLMPRAETREPG